MDALRFASGQHLLRANIEVRSLIRPKTGQHVRFSIECFQSTPSQRGAAFSRSGLELLLALH